MPCGFWYDEATNHEPSGYSYGLGWGAGFVQEQDVHGGIVAMPKHDAESQLDKFKELARQLEADEDEARWDQRLKKVAKHKPAPEKPD